MRGLRSATAKKSATSAIPGHAAPRVQRVHQPIAVSRIRDGLPFPRNRDTINGSGARERP